MTRKELIENTAAFYNSSNYSAVKDRDDSWECKYHLEDGRQCAVGRWMTPEAQQRFKAPYTGGVTDVITVLSKEVTTKHIYELTLPERSQVLDNALVEEAWGHPYGFWQDLQAFHDDDVNWCSTGITKYGEQKKETLLGRWAETEEKVP